MATANPVTIAGSAGQRIYGGRYPVVLSVLGGSAGTADAEASGAMDSTAPPPNARISFWGQSNAEGSALRAGITASPLSSDPGLEDFDDGTTPFTRVKFWNGSAYATLVPGSNAGTGATIMGPEFGVAVRWMRETVSGTLYLDKNAVGGTSITAFEPSVGARWTAGVANKAAQDAWLSSNGVTIADARTFWFWSQAEADYIENQAWYQPRMQDLVDGLIAADIMPYRGVITDIPSGHSRYNAGISAAKQAVADASGGTVINLMQNLYMESDNLHFNARGQVQVAYDAYAFFFDASTITV